MSEKATYLKYSLTDFRNTSGPIVDVRTPKEFCQGHVPGAINIPLFSDEEREIIGKIYKIWTSYFWSSNTRSCR